MPASSSASSGAFQYTPVLSSAATVTECSRSQSVIARRPFGSVLNSRTATRAGPRPASQMRNAAVICILCTSRPAARGQTTCMSSVRGSIEPEDGDGMAAAG